MQSTLHLRLHLPLRRSLNQSTSTTLHCCKSSHQEEMLRPRHEVLRAISSISHTPPTPHSLPYLDSTLDSPFVVAREVRLSTPSTFLVAFHPRKRHMPRNLVAKRIISRPKINFKGVAFLQGTITCTTPPTLRTGGAKQARVTTKLVTQIIYVAIVIF